MDIATKCQTHSAIKSHSKKEYIVRLLFDEKGYEIGYESTGEVVRCKDCKLSNWYTNRKGKTFCYCTKTGTGGKTSEDFCSDGERSE